MNHTLTPCDEAKRMRLMKHVTIQSLKEYLIDKGWTEEPFGRDEVLKFSPPTSTEYDIFIPSKRELIDYDQMVEIAIDGISAYEGRDFDSLLSEIIPCAVIELAELRDLIHECERLISKHRHDFALTQSLKMLRSREHSLKAEIRRQDQ